MQTPDRIQSTFGLRDATVLLMYYDFNKRPFCESERIYYNALLTEIQRFVATLKQE